MSVLDHAAEHRPTALDTDPLQVGATSKEFEDQIHELKIAQDKGERAKIDSYLCEFHHNIALTRTRYSPEDVTRQVRMMVNKGVVARPFAVAIDTTIAKTDEANIKDFL